ncbi:hypothetical protein QVG61_09405 [Thiohalobacter sp. IOR34]|uniref:hypothetical protein n=1 Tax=Thiohalobacter sp. IOR34 TaxID=3057176 RepID=UPI0025B12A37|nr:hypothetical protein [Thiohalobacter sp. IOR34]WJW74717.1 hypothetical protein QVG61_09405 [Thiohalobacter sp. IOR34]
MLNEYALEPEALGESWDRFRFLVSLFNVENGRVISRFPKKWTKMVYEAASGLSPLNRKRVEESLRHINRKLVASGRPYSGEKNWMENAISQHEQRPFKAIIARENATGAEYIVPADDVDENHPLLKVSREKAVRRTARELAAAVADILQNSKEILFLDPHFKPTRPKWISVLREFLQAAVSGKHRVVRCEYHFQWKDEFTCDEFHRHCDRLRGDIPKGICVRFVGWREKEDGERFHARYVLTDIGGVRFDVGLDHQVDGENQTTDVGLLDRGLYEKRWSDLQSETAAFDFVIDMTVVGDRD